jgi:hypothetical protein
MREKGVYGIMYGMMSMDPIMLFDFLIQPLREPPLRGSPPLRKGIVIKGGRLKKSKSIIASALRSSDFTGENRISQAPCCLSLNELELVAPIPFG